MSLRRFNFVFQWTGFRVCRVMDGGTQTHWGLLGPVLPLTGWGSDYRGWPTPRITWRCRAAAAA